MTRLQQWTRASTWGINWACGRVSRWIPSWQRHLRTKQTHQTFKRWAAWLMLHRLVQRRTVIKSNTSRNNNIQFRTWLQLHWPQVGEETKISPISRQLSRSSSTSRRKRRWVCREIMWKSRDKCCNINIVAIDVVMEINFGTKARKRVKMDKRSIHRRLKAIRRRIISRTEMMMKMRIQKSPQLPRLRRMFDRTQVRSQRVKMTRVRVTKTTITSVWSPILKRTTLSAPSVNVTEEWWHSNCVSTRDKPISNEKER